MSFRTEKDALGTIKVPQNAYFGSFTVRAQANFQISGIMAFQEFRQALGIIKKAAAQTNANLKELEPTYAQAIIQAANEFISGKFDSEFTLDVFQAGAGTPFNMNCNEILANRANEILGYAKGAYSPVTPNNHVNWAQSSNDVIPTAIRIAALIKAKKLLPEIQKLTLAFAQKAKQFEKILKVGRTHLQDAVPIRLGQEFEAYASALQRCYKHTQNAFDELLELGIGGTALGTGITAHPDFRTLMVKNLSKLTGFSFKPTKYPMELTHGMNAFAIASDSLKILANDLIRIANDLKLLNSGPFAGIAEIILPEVEPGSSIMPGKINPSIPEAMNMIGFQVCGNDHTIHLAVQGGQLELNVMTPVIMHNLLWSIDLLTNGCTMFRRFCVEGIKADEKRCKELLERSLCLATGLSPYLGYKKTAELVNEAMKKGKSLKQTVQDHGFIDPKALEKILAAEKLTQPSKKDKKILLKLDEKKRN